MVLVGTAHLNLLVLKLLVSQVVDVWEPQEDIYWGPERMVVISTGHIAVILVIVN
jgi:catalase (peroxidase I)